METGKSFADFMVAAEAVLGSKPDPDRAYEAFSLGVSPEVFAKTLVTGSSQVREEDSPLPVQAADSFQLAPSSASFQLTDKQISPQRGLLLTFGTILFLVIIFSIWIPNETEKVKRRNVPSSPPVPGPSPRLAGAKAQLQYVIGSKNAEQLQQALANGKGVDSVMGDQELKVLIGKAQALFAPLEASWKKSKREQLEREELQLIVALRKATSQKNQAALVDALMRSQGFKVRVGKVSEAHAEAQVKAGAMLKRVAEAVNRNAMRQYEGSPVGIAVAELEIRRSFDGYSFDGNGRFVSVFVSVRNEGAESEHINPTNFTLATEDGYTVPYSAHTFSTGRPLNAVNIGPGATTAGWIVFESVLSRRYKLIHEPLMGGGRVEKVLVP